MSTAKDARFAIVNTVVSLSAVLFLGWLLLLNPGIRTDLDLSFVPAVNAALNAAAAVLLVSAVAAIKRGDRDAHRRRVLGAFACSAIFLAGYVAYHAVHGDTRYQGEGALRAIYLFILATHVILSISVLPLALTCLYLAYQERFDGHRKVARVTFPIWLYVSVTGVVIFFMLRAAQ